MTTRLQAHHKAALLEIIKASIDLSGYEGYSNVYEVFKAEKDWEIVRVGEQNACEDWLRGLPSACTIPFMNGDIDAIWESMQVVQSHDAYWYNMAVQLLKHMKSL